MEPPVNDIECREPAEIELRSDLKPSFSMFAITNEEEKRFRFYINCCGVSAVLVIMGFVIYQVVGK